MKKIINLLFAVTLFVSCSANAQPFPLLNGVYSSNCDDASKSATYWAIDKSGKIIRYGFSIERDRFKYSKMLIEKYEYADNKLTFDGRGIGQSSSTQSDVLEVGDGGKSYRVLARVFNGKETIKNGRWIDNNTELLSIGRCAPDTQLSIKASPSIDEISRDNIQSADSEKAEKNKTKIYASVKDFPVGEEIQISALPKSLMPEVCKNISSVDNNIAPTVLTMAAPMANSGALAQIYRNGGGRWDGMFISGATCVADFVINGSYNGTGYNVRMSCPIDKVKRNNPKNTKLDLIWVDSFSCRKVG